jgi:hypothetical protein
MIVLLKFFIAHFIGDFLLQPPSWVKAKQAKKLGAWQLYVHSLIHGILILILVWDQKFIVWAGILALIHLMIDATKSLMQTRRNQRWLFFIDQLFHFISIYVIWLFFENKFPSFSFLNNGKIILLITLLIFLTRPMSVAVKIFISKWTPDTESGEATGIHIYDIKRVAGGGLLIGCKISFPLRKPAGSKGSETY